MILTEYDEEGLIRTWQEDGYERGRQEKAVEDAIEFLKENISPETIAKCVKLPLEEVIKLKEQLSVTA